jgi:hypothetical protein
MRRRWRSVTPSRGGDRAGSAAGRRVHRLFEQARGVHRPASATNPSRQPRRDLGPALQAGPEGRRLGLRGVAKKRQFSRRGVRTRHTGRQYTPVEVTPTKSGRRSAHRASAGS